MVRNLIQLDSIDQSIIGTMKTNGVPIFSLATVSSLYRNSKSLVIIS